ncbi:MAG: hypothetical protein WCO84_07635, partial [bacterium]
LHERPAAKIVDAPIRPDHAKLGVEILSAAERHLNFKALVALARKLPKLPCFRTTSCHLSGNSYGH